MVRSRWAESARRRGARTGGWAIGGAGGARWWMITRRALTSAPDAPCATCAAPCLAVLGGSAAGERPGRTLHVHGARRRLPRPEPLRRITPLHSGLHPMIDPVDHLTAITREQCASSRAGARSGTSSARTTEKSARAVRQSRGAQPERLKKGAGLLPQTNSGRLRLPRRKRDRDFDDSGRLRRVRVSAALAISSELRAALPTFPWIGNVVGEGSANRFVNFIEAAYIMPVNKEQSIRQELLVRTVGWPVPYLPQPPPRAPRRGGTRREHKDLTGKHVTAGIA